MKILIVEDEIELQKSIQEYLELENNLVSLATTYSDAEFKIADNDYDCILLDITLPKGSGLDLIKTIKSKKSKAGIIIISAKNSFDDKILGLDLGADDYLPKPFYLPELNSRINAVVRRKKFDGNLEINCNEIKIIPSQRAVFVNTIPLVLTTKEYDLLLYFISNKNRVVTKNALVNHLWGDTADGFDNFDFIYNHVKNLRKKLVEKNCIDYLSTIYGIGYNFKTEQ